MRILFVSQNDRCRGPMARMIAEYLTHKAELFGMVYDSCGVAVNHGETAYLEVIGFLKRERMNIMSHRTKALSQELADNADVIFAMDAETTDQAKQVLGEYYAPKVVLLNKGVDLISKNMDIPLPNLQSFDSIRRTYACLRASIGRLIRTLEEPDCTAEFFGAKTIAKRNRPGAANGKKKAPPKPVDPKLRQFLANFIFDFIERSFEPPTTAAIQDAVKGAGQSLSVQQLLEILRQDLHGYAALDKDGSWYVVAGAAEERKERARAEARARAEREENQREKYQQQRAREEKKTEEPKEKLTVEMAYEALAITKDTDKSEAQKKYRALLQRYHPDKFHDDPEFAEMASAKTLRINQAWELVKDRLPES